jgi:sulfite reductase beta subunit-like hemoprotein
MSSPFDVVLNDERMERIDPLVRADIEKLARHIELNLAGDLPDDVFRVVRLNNGVYGQRQGGHNQMIRVKAPWGTVTPEQLDRFADVAERYRGWGHLTTRQNVQFHFVPLTDVPKVLLDLAEVGLTTREACGDTVRNVCACPLAGACPYEVLDVTPWADAAFDHFLRHAYSQRLPRKFKINFSGCATDCGQAMFNDVGVVAVSRPTDDGDTEAGFRVFFGGGLGANPVPAYAVEPFTSREDLLPTIEAVLRVFDHDGNRDNKLRARLKWVVANEGEEEVRRRIVRERKFLRASVTWRGGIPEIVRRRGDEPAGIDTTASLTPVGQGTPVVDRVATPVSITPSYERWSTANVVRGAAKGTVSAFAYARLGDITPEQFRGLAAIQRDFGCDVRITNRQNFALLGLAEDQLPDVHVRLDLLGMAQPGAELARDVVSCPGADTCQIAVTQSRGLAAAIGDALDEAGLGDVGGVRINISGCTNSCGQHHVADIGFFGAERRAHGRSAPGYQMLLGGRVRDTQIEFGQKATRLPAKRAAEATVKVVERFTGERSAGETFSSWLDRSGGASGIGAWLKDLDNFPTPDEAPDFYIDFDETGPYVADVGEGECAAT